MINLIKAELIKITGKKSTKIAIVIVLVLMVCSCIFQATSEADSTNWRELLQQEVDFAKSEIEENKGTDMEAFYEELYRADVAIGEYSLEHNIANNVVTPIKFAYKNTFCMSVWVILLLILAAINFSDEYQFGTIKQILSRPYKRSRILFIKQIVFLGISLVVMLLQMAISYLVGIIFFEKNGVSDVTIDYVNGKVIEIDMSTALWQTYFSYIVIITFLIAVAYLLIAIVRTTIMPVIISLSIWLSADLIAESLSKYEIIRYTFFPHLNLTQYIVGNNLVIDGNTIGLSLLVLAITYIVIEIFTYRIFDKRDI